MKIAIITFDEPFYIVNLFKPVIKKHRREISAIFIVPPKAPNINTVEFIKEQITIMGKSQFVKNALKYLKEISLIRIGLSSKSIKSVAKENKIPIYEFNSVNENRVERSLNRIKPDIVLTQVPEIIKPKVLKAARIGFINKHASLLPKYRGKHPLFWALLNKENKVGFTLHLMDENIDSGKILFQKSVKVKKGDSVSSLYKKIFSEAGLELSKLLTKIKNDNRLTILKKSNTKMKQKYYSTPSREDIKKFKKMGLKHG